MLLILALLILILLLRLWWLSQPQQIKSIKSLRQTAKPSSIKALWQRLKPWLTPGWCVQKLSFKVASNRLLISRSNFSEDDFYRLKQGLLWLGGAAFFYWLWIGDFSWTRFYIFLVLWILFFSLPEIYGWLLLQRRKRQIEKEVPYFLDLLTLTLQSGSNLEQALVATTKCYDCLLSKNMAMGLEELAWGRPIEAILKDLKAEIQNDDFSHFLNSVVRAKKLGVSLNETLTIQVEILRTKRRQKAEELSRTAAVKISLPLVLFIFPALLIIYIGPGILQLLERT